MKSLDVRKGINFNDTYVVMIQRDGYVLNTETGVREMVTIKYPAELTLGELDKVLSLQTNYSKFEGFRESSQTIITVDARSAK